MSLEAACRSCRTSGADPHSPEHQTRWGYLASECRAELQFGQSARALEIALGFETRCVAVNRGDGEDTAAAPVGHRRVLRAEAAVDFDGVPLLGVPDIVDAHVVVLAPEERDGVEALAQAEHVLCGNLTLALGHTPVLDANAVAGMRVGPPRDVTRREHAGNAGLQILVDRESPVGGEPGLLGPRDRRPHANARDDEIGIDAVPVA